MMMMSRSRLTRLILNLTARCLLYLHYMVITSTLLTPSGFIISRHNVDFRGEARVAMPQCCNAAVPLVGVTKKPEGPNVFSNAVDLALLVEVVVVHFFSFYICRMGVGTGSPQYFWGIATLASPLKSTL